MRGIGAGTRIFELLDRRPAIAPNQGIDVDPSRRGVIRFENVGFEYPSRKGVQILDDFNLEIGVGENVALVYVIVRVCGHALTKSRGKSGGGKSSVQSLLLRYYDPVRGKVTFDGQGLSAVCLQARPNEELLQTFVNSIQVRGATLSVLCRRYVFIFYRSMHQFMSSGPGLVHGYDRVEYRFWQCDGDARRYRTRRSTC